MKTTVEISDALLAAARKLAAKNGTTVRALIEEGLRRVVQARSAKPFKLRDSSWGSGGLRPEVRGASWERILDASYEGRGT
jgi:putative antitoxin of VapBC-like toxin-antitoxin system